MEPRNSAGSAAWPSDDAGFFCLLENNIFFLRPGNIFYNKNASFTFYDLSGVGLVAGLHMEWYKVTRSKNAYVGMYHFDRPPIAVTVRCDVKQIANAKDYTNLYCRSPCLDMQVKY
jgi:hypothetical protein